MLLDHNDNNKPPRTEISTYGIIILSVFKIYFSIPYLIVSFTQVYDSIQVDIASGKIQDTIKFDSGNLCMVTGGRNTGRVGTIMSRERHPGSFDIVHVKDASGHTFATRINYVFIIGMNDCLEGIQKS